jgi:hypothetical protein
MVYGQSSEKTATAIVHVEPGAAPGGPTMNKVTLYVKDSDRELYERAKRLVKSGESVSSLVAEGLTIVVERRERARTEGDVIEPIELEGADYFNEERTRRLRFQGILAAEGRDFAIYMTKARKIVLEVVMPDSQPNKLRVFNSFDDFKDDHDIGNWTEPGTLEEVAEAAGVEYFEEIE